MKFDAIIFDFDGVLLESEYAGNRQIAEYLTSIGHPTTPEDSMANFMGLAGADFLGAIEKWIGRAIPESFHQARAIEDRRALEEGLPAVAGAIRFIDGRHQCRQCRAGAAGGAPVALRAEIGRAHV